MKKYSWMSSAAGVIGALEINDIPICISQFL